MDNRNTFSNLTDPNYAEHYGTPHMGHVPHSGRYPWGSGDNPNQHDRKFLERVDSYKAQGMTQLQIAKSMNMTTTQLREEIGKRRAAVDAADLAKARKLMAQGMSRNQAAKIIGRNESTLRSMEKTEKNSRSVTTQQNVDELKKLVEKYKYVDVGKGSENGIGATGITSYKLNSALQALKAEGYVIEGPYYTQMTTGKRTNQKILCPPGTTWAEVQNNQDKIVTPGHVMFYDSREKELHLLERPVNIDSKRVQVRYAEDGGSDKDGLIELRRGCEDLDLCRARYAQVRIAVDGTHYLKGVAVYGRDKDFEPGKDIIYNSSKKRGTPLMSDDPDAKQVFKPMEKGNPQNPFGAEIKPESRLKMVQKRYTGSDGKEHLSALNIVNEEGDWMEWHKSLASQFLSKQPPALAKQQLGLARKALEEEYEEICMFTNPTVRAKLKAEFADKCDEQATELRGMPLPRQTTCAILPMPTLKPNECYDPAHRDGEEVIMVRYPCAGIFEIPRLTVNNRNREGRELIGINPKDAVGIHPKTAQQLSGADFDGDNVLVIPTKGLNIRTHGPLSQLKDFDPREEFPNRPGIKPMTKHQRGIEMGKATNPLLI